MMNLERFESLGFNILVQPKLGSPVNLYAELDAAPIAKLFLTEKGYMLRFGSSVFENIKQQDDR